jgi:hypothetical protein
LPINPITLHGVITLLLWLVFAWMLRRALHNQRFTQRRAVYIWIQVALGLITVSLMGQTVEASLDRFWSGWPVTLYIKTMAMLSLFHLYYLTIREIDTRSHHYRYLADLGPLALLGGTLYFLLGSPSYSRSDFRYQTLALRDGIMVVYIVSAFLPSSWRLWRLEQVGSMKVKHLASIVCCLCYLLIAGGNIIVAVLNARRAPQIESLSTACIPVAYLGAISFLVILVPHRWLVPLRYPDRLYRWWRLHRLEVQLRTWGVAQRWQPTGSLRALLPDQLELTIYRSVIFILDGYPLIRTQPQGKALYQQIGTIAQSPLPYAELVKSLSELV